MDFLATFVSGTGLLATQMLDAKTALPPSAGCASGRSGAVSVASLSAAPRSFSWGISASAVAPEGAIMPAAAQQRLFVTGVSTPLVLRSKTVSALMFSCWFFMPLSSDVRQRVGPSGAGDR